MIFFLITLSEKRVILRLFDGVGSMMKNADVAAGWKHWLTLLLKMLLMVIYLLMSFRMNIDSYNNRSKASIGFETVSYSRLESHLLLFYRE